MRKFIPLILFPYLAAFDINAIFESGYLSKLPKSASMALGILFIALNVVEFLFLANCIIWTGKKLFSEKDNSYLLRRIINVKLIQIPAYIYIFIVGFLLFTLPLGFIITIICFIADCWSIFFTGLLVSLSMGAKLRRKEISAKFAILHGILSFIFCIDVIDGIFLKVRFKEGGNQRGQTKENS